MTLLVTEVPNQIKQVYVCKWGPLNLLVTQLIQ